MSLPFLTPDDVARAIPVVRAHLAAGKLLAYPTETVYGLGCAPTEAALTALASLKGRPPKKPFLLLVSSEKMPEDWGLVYSRAAAALAAAFWPGPLTLILKGGEGRLPDRLRGAEGGIGVRYTSHRGIRDLVEACGVPLTSTSANRPGSPPAAGAEGIEPLFADAVRAGDLLVLDGGVLGNVPPSTIVDCTEPLPRMVRDGAIPRTELRRAVGSLAP